MMFHSGWRIILFEACGCRFLVRSSCSLCKFVDHWDLRSIGLARWLFMCWRSLWLNVLSSFYRSHPRGNMRWFRIRSHFIAWSHLSTLYIWSNRRCLNSIGYLLSCIFIFSNQSNLSTREFLVRSIRTCWSDFVRCSLLSLTRIWTEVSMEKRLFKW